MGIQVIHSLTNSASAEIAVVSYSEKAAKMSNAAAAV